MTTHSLTALGQILAEAGPVPNAQPIAIIHEITVTGATTVEAAERAIKQGHKAYGKPVMTPWVRSIVPVGLWTHFRVTVAYAVAV